MSEQDSEWEFVKLQSIASKEKNAIVGGPFGSNLVSKDYVFYGVPVIRGQNMGNRWVGGEFVYVSEMKANSLSTNLAKPYDVVFTQRGTLGQVSIVPKKPFSRYVISQSQMKISVDKNLSDPFFVYYLFKSQEMIDYITRNTIQTALPHINLGFLKEIQIPLPPLPTQKAIAHILGTLDDKIELNRRMNETLESIARAIFTSWFIDFDPVRAKAEGRQPEGMDAATAALFPSEFETVEGQEIPKGWHVKPFIEIIEIIGGGTPKTSDPDYWNGNIPWFSVVDSPSVHDVWVIDTEKKITEDGLNNSSTRLLTIGTTIITARGTVGNLALVGNPMTMNQSCYGLKPKADIGPYFSYYQIKSLIDELKQNTHGSVFDTITRDTFSHFSIIIPNKKICSKYEEITNLILEKIKQNLFESKNLSSIRDTLLPKLLSGELPITNPEQFTGVS